MVTGEPLSKSNCVLSPIDLTRHSAQLAHSMKRRGLVTTSGDRVDSVGRVARRACSLALLYLLAIGQRVADCRYSILEASCLSANATAKCLPLGGPAVLRDVTRFITVEAGNSLAAA